MKRAFIAAAMAAAVLGGAGYGQATAQPSDGQGIGCIMDEDCA